MKAKRNTNIYPLVFLRKFMLLKANLTITDIAGRLNVSQSFVSQLISGKKHSQAKEAAICRLLRVRREVLW